jgi:hypothetical protein
MEPSTTLQDGKPHKWSSKERAKITAQPPTKHFCCKPVLNLLYFNTRLTTRAL